MFLFYRYPLPLLDRYHTKGFSPVYIVTFVLWCIFVLSKVLLAVVNSSFVEVQRDKFKSMYLHRRSGGLWCCVCILVNQCLCYVKGMLFVTLLNFCKLMGYVRMYVTTGILCTYMYIDTFMYMYICIMYMYILHMWLDFGKKIILSHVK